MPAPAARMRSARFPCGTTSSSIRGAIERIETMRIALARERTEDLAHPPFADQQRKAGIAIAGVIADHREIPRAVFDQRVDQLGRLARQAEAADQDDGAVGDAVKCPRKRMSLVDHDCVQNSTLSRQRPLRLEGWRGVPAYPFRRLRS